MAFSYSQLSTYQRCPRQYEYASVKKLPRAMSPGESFGSSVHNTLRKFGLLELEAKPPEGKKQLPLFIEEHPQDTPRERTLTTLLSLWRESFIAEGFGGKAEMDERFREGETALRQYYDWWSATPHDVIAIEKSFSLDVGEGITLSGRFDRVERTAEGIVIIDYKSTGPRPSASVNSDLQLSLYALAAADQWKDPVAGLMLLCIRPEGVTEQRTTRTAAALEEALTTIRDTARRINKKDFGATPSHHTCGHCPFRHLCPSRI